MSFKEFVGAVRAGAFNDDDGYGDLYIDGFGGFLKDNSIVIAPSDLLNLRVRWYNK